MFSGANLQKLGRRSLLFLLISTIIVLVITMGSLGHNIVKLTPLPTLAAVKLISAFNTIEKIESLLVTIWILADFILISVFAFTFTHIIKLLFNLRDARFMISPLLIFIYFSSLMLAGSRFELEQLSQKLFLPMNLVFQFLIPFVIFLMAIIKRRFATG